MSRDELRSSGISVSRAFRLDRKYSDLMINEAQSQRTSLSSLLGRIIKDYLTLHSYTEKYPIVVLSQHEMDAFIGLLTMEQAESLGSKMGSMTPISLLLMRGMSAPDLDSLIWLLEEVYGRRMGWFTIHNNVVGDERILYLSHKLSSNWTAFLSSYMSSMFDSILGMKVTQERQENYMTVRIPLSKEKGVT